MRNHETPESLVILASALYLLLRATDGMLVDGETCTLPQLELLEATARAVQLVLEWGESGVAVADGLLNLLKVAARSYAKWEGDGKISTGGLTAGLGQIRWCHRMSCYFYSCC